MNASHRPTRFARRCGFTFAEVLIALALMAVLMAATGVAVQAGGVSRAYNLERTDLVARARGVLDRISRDMRVAKTVNTANSRALIFTMADASIREYLWDGTTGGNMSFIYTSPVGTINAAVVLTGGVTTFTVSDPPGPCYSMTLTLTGTKSAITYTITATPRSTVY
jgi:prepilin-type N-terminal cleavage/methylation domain-containing protein